MAIRTSKLLKKPWDNYKKRQVFYLPFFDIFTVI